MESLPERSRSALEKIKGTSRAIETFRRELQALVDEPEEIVAQICGESGVGKELAADALHELWGGKGAMVKINCSTLGDHQAALSELFGHCAGAYTGAVRDRNGAFIEAGEGTVFLDEFGDLPRSVQPFLLRAIENRSVKPLGRDREVDFKARLIVATDLGLKAMVENGTFRHQLYYRINGAKLIVPPLRDRLSDIPLLAEAVFARRMPRSTVRLSSGALELLLAHDWPGNVRELFNTLHHAARLARDAAEILPEHIRIERLVLPGATEQRFDDPNWLHLLGLPLDDVNRLAFEKGLQRNDGNGAATARELKCDPKTVQRFRARQPDARSGPPVHDRGQRREPAAAARDGAPAGLMGRSDT